MIIKKVLVANRGEIDIRVLRGFVELNLRIFDIESFINRYSQDCNLAEESYQIG